MKSFLSILREAKGDKTPKTPKEDEANDYSTGLEDEENANDQETGQQPDEDSTNNEDNTVEDEASDYTEEDDTADPNETGDDPTVDTTEDEASDYTSDGTDGSTTDEPTDETVEEDDPEEKENNRILLEDFINLFNTIKNTISKLTNANKSNILINKIISQILINLNSLKKVLYNYIIFNFSDNKYVNNLYKYNYFMEAFRINVEMLKKISVLAPNS